MPQGAQQSVVGSQTGAVISAAIGVDTDLTLVYQLFAFLFCMIVLSRIALRFQHPQVLLRRRIPRYATVDEPFEYKILVTNIGASVERDLSIVDNPRVIPPDFSQFSRQHKPGEESRNAYDRWIGFHRFVWLQRFNTGIAVDRAAVPDIHLENSEEATVQATPLRRGIVHFASSTLLHPDPLGLNYGVIEFPNPEQLMVLPKRYPVSDRFLLPDGRHFQPGGIQPTWSIGESEEFVALRDYRDGDPVRKIHWPSSAKRGKPVIREYQDEFFVRHSMVIDTMTDDREVMEEAVSVAASLVLKMRDTDGIVDVVFVADRPTVVTTGRGYAQSDQQLEALATLNPCERPFADLSELVRSQSKLMSGCYLVLTGWDEPRHDLVRYLTRHNIPTRVLLIARLTSALWQLPDSVTLLPLGEIGVTLSP